MKLSEARRLQLLSWASGIMASREPDLIIGDDYVHRWKLHRTNTLKGKLFNVYVHRFYHDDSDEALHDHEPDNCSVILDGDYIEHFHVRPLERELVGGQVRYRTKSLLRRQGDVIFRLAGTPHRIALRDGPVTTLFIQGPRRRKWGFWCPSGWKPWDEYIDARSSYGSRRGEGCG